MNSLNDATFMANKIENLEVIPDLLVQRPTINKKKQNPKLTVDQNLLIFNLICSEQ